MDVVLSVLVQLILEFKELVEVEEVLADSIPLEVVAPQ